MKLNFKRMREDCRGTTIREYAIPGTHGLLLDVYFLSDGPGWFYDFCVEGEVVPETPPEGPFPTLRKALAHVREQERRPQ